MKGTVFVAAVYAFLILLGSSLVLAQQPAQQQPPQPMTFFVTSAGSGNGANLGGLAGADQICQTRAQAVGAGNHTWHAYLSTQASGGQSAVNARDRIGSGPWYNAKGARVAKDVGDLHGDTLDKARLGSNLGKQTALTEKGTVVNGVGDTPNTHDMLTGTQPDGRAFTDSADHTCNNWRATALARRNWATRIAMAAGTTRGTRRIRAGAAAKTTWSAPAAPACSTASRLINSPPRGPLTWRPVRPQRCPAPSGCRPAICEVTSQFGLRNTS